MSAKRNKHKLLDSLKERLIFAAVLVVAVILIIVIWRANTGKNASSDTESQAVEQISSNTESTEELEPQVITYSAETTGATWEIGESVVSQHAILVDLSTDSIVAQKGANEVISPASMTKVLTVLVAAEQLKDMKQLDDTVQMIPEITDYAFINDCSTAGFEKDEVVTVRDLFYGTILPSGGDAAVGLATYISGSQDAFVDLMNKKVDELGLSETAHFTNCVGVYNDELHCTVYDMAMIMEAAMENDFCREVLGAKAYTTSITEQHPEGIVLCNKLILRTNSKEANGVILGGKTGYVVQSGSCGVTFAEDNTGKAYICVTAGSSSPWQCVYDQVALYDTVMQ